MSRFKENSWNQLPHDSFVNIWFDGIFEKRKLRKFAFAICFCKTCVKSTCSSRNYAFLPVFTKYFSFHRISHKLWQVYNVTPFWKILLEINLWYNHSEGKYYKTRSRKKKFREINSLVTSLVKTLISRKKCWFFRKNRKFSVKILTP